MSDLQRIASDLARCKERIQQMERGERGQIPAEAMHVNSGLAFENQLLAQRNAQVRLEGEYVQAMLGRGWSAGEIIRRMEMRLPEVEN